MGLGVLTAFVVAVDSLAFDAIGLVALAGVAAPSTLVVTMLTTLALKRAMHPDGLRTE